MESDVDEETARDLTTSSVIASIWRLTAGGDNRARYAMVMIWDFYIFKREHERKHIFRQ